MATSMLLFACEIFRPEHAACFDGGNSCYCNLTDHPQNGSAECPADTYGCCMLEIERTVGGDPQVLRCSCSEFEPQYGCYSHTVSPLEKIRVAECTAQSVEEVEHGVGAPVPIADDRPQ